MFLTREQEKRKPHCSFSVFTLMGAAPAALLCVCACMCAIHIYMRENRKQPETDQQMLHFSRVSGFVGNRLARDTRERDNEGVSTDRCVSLAWSICVIDPMFFISTFLGRENLNIGDYFWKQNVRVVGTTQLVLNMCLNRFIVCIFPIYTFQRIGKQRVSALWTKMIEFLSSPSLRQEEGPTIQLIRSQLMSAVWHNIFKCLAPPRLRHEDGTKPIGCQLKSAFWNQDIWCVALPSLRHEEWSNNPAYRVSTSVGVI